MILAWASPFKSYIGFEENQNQFATHTYYKSKYMYYAVYIF